MSTVFSQGNITPLFSTASICFLVKPCNQCPQMTMAVRLLDRKRVHVMGNRGYSCTESALMRLVT